MGDAPNELEVLEARREILQLEIALAQEDRDPLRETLIENQKETPNLNRAVGVARTRIRGTSTTADGFVALKLIPRQ